ncbi:hypothetical protein GHT06_017775 [Daphnia sinensis]|uniref:Uncharacterized protein n=1 Tax=Daphnia sinensis TaxID=1820382 RepID=A0AAD5L4Q7_9CRUS|nr:hypothetical protein GHT06_017775 [Daphnia sinensis]
MASRNATGTMATVESISCKVFAPSVFPLSILSCVSCICRCQHGATNPDGPDKARRLGIALLVIF